MRVKNRKCIRRLSFKSLWASRKRNINLCYSTHNFDVYIIIYHYAVCKLKL